jgi:hypothetical protein
MIQQREFAAAARETIVADEDTAQLLAAIEHGTVDPLPLYLLARVCRRDGDLGLWHQGVRLAMSLEHKTKQQLYCRARVKLLLGDWSGWKDYNARCWSEKFRCSRSGLALLFRWTCVQWDGAEDLHGMRLMVIGEQGFGDVMQMLRFVPALTTSAAQVLVTVPSRLVTFAQYNYGSCASVIFSGFEQKLSFDRYVWSMSLPAYAPALPTFTPLRAPSPRVRGASQTLRIGVCWSGNPHYAYDRIRSIPLAILQPLFDLTDVEWHCLQVGERAADADAFPQIVRPDPPLDSFSDTANLTAGLDCVISSDTSVCHLSGSLGIKTFLLLPFDGNWRWGLERTTPWYPSMEIIRQPTPGDWEPAVQSLRGRLEALRVTGSALELASSRG